MITIQLTATPSLNKLQGKWSKGNWKKKYLKQLRGYGHLFPGKVKRRVVSQRFGSRILDLDNFIGGHKPLFDALKELQIIVDDRAKWCLMEFLPQVKCGRGQEKTVIKISEVI